MKPRRSLADISAASPAVRAAARRNRADQRQRDRAAGVDRIGVGEAFLAVDHDAQPVAGVEMIGRVVRDRHRLGIGDRDRRSPAHAARKRQRSNQTWNWGENASHYGNPEKVSSD